MCSRCIDPVMIKSKPPNNYIIIDVSIINFSQNRLIDLNNFDARILCFDLNNGQMPFRLKKINFQGHGPAGLVPNMRAI